MIDLLNPTEEHAALRRTLREFVEREVDPQAAAHDRSESFNLELFRKLGDLGVLGITVAEAFGGAGMDAVAAVHRSRRARGRRSRLRARLPRPLDALREQLLPERERRTARPLPSRRLLRKEDRRHVHERAVGRHRRARHEDDGDPQGRRLRALRRQDVDHQRRGERYRARRRLSRLCADRRQGHPRALALPRRERPPRIQARPEAQGQARHARLDDGGARLRSAARCRSRIASARKATPYCT